jgi:hypothetical protein
MLEDLERTIQILHIDICTEEERVQVFDRADPLYSVLARTLTSRRDNLIVTVADLEKRLYTTTPISEAACGSHMRFRTLRSVSASLDGS